MIPAALLTLFTEEMAIVGSLTWLREFLSESRYMTEEREERGEGARKKEAGRDQMLMLTFGEDASCQDASFPCG